MAELVRHRLTKGSATDRLHLNHRATPRLHTSSPVPVLHLSGFGVNQELAVEIEMIMLRFWAGVLGSDFRDQSSKTTNVMKLIRPVLSKARHNLVDLAPFSHSRAWTGK